MENDTVTVANTNKKDRTNKQKLDKNDNTKPKRKPHNLYIKACVPATSTTLSRPLSESEYPPRSILPDPRGTEDVMSKASARLKSSLKIVAVADEDEWYERVN